MPSLTEYRRRFAQDLRAYRPDEGGVATGGTASTLIQANYPIQRNLDESAEFDGWFVLRPGVALVPPVTGVYVDKVRTINPGLYAPRSGTITVDRPYASPPGVGEAFELHGHGFEPFNAVNNLLNAALRDIHVLVTIPYLPRVSVGTQGTYVLNLTDGDGSGAPLTRIPALLHPAWVHKIDHQPTASAQKQTIAITGSPGAGGTWLPTYRGFPTPVGTVAVPVGGTATGPVVQTALRTVPGLEAVTVADPPGGSGNNLTYVVTMVGAPVQGPPLGFNPSFSQGAIAATITADAGITVPQRGRLDLDGSAVLFYSDRHYDSGDCLYVTCRLRASDWCRAGNTVPFGTLAGPLTAEANEAVPVVEWVSAMMQVYGWRRRPDLMQMGVEQRQIASQATAQALVDAYENEFFRRLERSPLLRLPVQGGEPILGALPPGIGGPGAGGAGGPTPAEVAAAVSAGARGGQG